jgi:hypothetical protein
MAQEEDKKSSPFASAGIGAVILVAIAALFGLRPGGNTDAPRSASQPAEDKTAPIASTRFADSKEPHLAFLLKNVRSKPIPGAKPGASLDAFSESITRAFSPLPSKELRFTPEEARRLKVVIATVPDPIDTAFGFWYDQLLESLTRAVCDTEFYTPAGQWTPWEQYRLDASGKDKKSEVWPPFRHFPGVLLFRSTATEKADHFFAVLLVGETTGSVAVAPLYRALALARNVQTADEPIRLIAPVFTGAELSLLSALKDWHKSDDKARFAIITGSATGLSLSAKDHPGITLKSTMIPTKIVAHAALKYLRSNARDVHKVVHEELGDSAAARLYERVAFLVESNTGFGRAMQKAEPKTSMPQNWPMYLPYPMQQLSRLKRAYTKKRMEKEERIALGGMLARAADDRSARPSLDAPPSMDEAVTAAIDDAAVDDMTATIRQNHVRYVGILATDPEDKVFLVERLRRDCPNVDIFLNHMDRVYLLPWNRQIMRGVIVSTTYPLYPPNQDWTDSTDPRRQTFKSPRGQGYYNAAAFHLADMILPRDLPGDEKDKLLAKWLQEYSPPSFAFSGQETVTKLTKPPVWIMTIGEQGQLVPLVFFQNYETTIKDLMAVAPPPIDAPEAATIMLPNLGPYRTIGLVVFVAVGTVLCFSIRRSSRWLFFGRAPDAASPLARPTRRRRFWAWFAAPMSDAEQGVSLCHSLILAGLTNCLLPAFIVVAALLTPVFAKTGLDWSCLVPMAALMGLAVLCSFLLLLRTIVRYARSAHSDGGIWWLRFAGHAALLLGALAFAQALVRRFPADLAHRVLFVTRTTDILTGYSVLPPLVFLAAGFFLYGYLALKRDYLADRFRVECPYPPLTDNSERASAVTQVCGKINGLADEVRKDMTDFPDYRDRHRSVLIVSALIFVPSTALIFARLLRANGTREGLFWDVLFLTWFFLLAILVLLMLLRFIAGWRGLERMLKLMALVPMVRAFDRLPRKTAALFGGYFFARRPRLSHLAIPAHILRQLQHEACQREASAPPPLVPVLAGSPASDSPSDPHASNSPQGQVVGYAECPSQMPVYEDIPEAIARRLSATQPESAFDYMPTPTAAQAPAAHPERAPDTLYPKDEINKFSREAQTLMGNLERYWPWHTVADAFGEHVSHSKTEKNDHDKTPTMPAWVEKAEDFIAIQAIIFLSQYFILLRTTALAMVWVAILLLLAATSYVFQPEQFIMYLLLGLLTVVVGVIVWVLIRVNKNEIVSRITQSTPNRFELTWNFALSLIQFVGPIAVIVIAHLSGRLRAVVEPFLEVLR